MAYNFNTRSLVNSQNTSVLSYLVFVSIDNTNKFKMLKFDNKRELPRNKDTCLDAPLQVSD